jgi:tRNA dimethylallyltransferase
LGHSESTANQERITPDDALHPLLVLTGPTAVGKSDVALQVAEALSAEIVSADSRQVYCYMDVGTAKPGLADRARVPHHMIDVAYPDEPYSIARYRREAERSLQEVMERDRVPLVVGGSPHYLQALVDRLEPAGQSRPLRRWLERADAAAPGALDRWLAALDPASAQRIDARNRRRVLRAIEVSFLTGLPFSQAGRRRSQSRPALWIGLRRDREVLRQRIETRVLNMIGAGWLEEVRTLLLMGYASKLPALSATGYPELARVVHGEWSLEEAVERIRFATQAFLRRQETWLRSEARIQWIDAERSDAADRVIAAWQDFLHNRKMTPYPSGRGQG